MPDQRDSTQPTHLAASNQLNHGSFLKLREEAELIGSMPDQVEGPSLLDKSNLSQSSMIRDEALASAPSSQGNHLSSNHDDSSQHSRSSFARSPGSHRMRQTSNSARDTMTGPSRAEAALIQTNLALYSAATPLSSPDGERPTSFLLAPTPAPFSAPTSNMEALDLAHSRTRSRSDNSQVLGGASGGNETISSSSHAHNQFPFLPYTGTLPPHGPEQRISLPHRAHDAQQTSSPGRAPAGQADSAPGTDLQPLMPLVFQPSLNLVMLNYNSIFARIHHFLYAPIYFAHIPITLFFDYSVLHALVQIVLHPSPTSPSNVELSDRRVNPWWLLVGFYGLCTLVWLGVVFIYEIYYCYIREWNKGHPSIVAIYLRPSAFQLCSLRSFSRYSFLWRIRLGAFTGIGSIAPNHRDGIIELCYSFMQNWPTIVTVIPRTAASLLLLLSFTSAHSHDPAPSQGQYRRDDLYFRSDGMLTRYATGVNLAHLSWAISRTLVIVLSSLVYWFLTRHVGPSLPSSSEGCQDAYTRTSWAPSLASSTPLRPQTWKDRLRLRILEAVLLSSSRERWRAAIERRERSNARRRKLSKNPASEGRRASKIFAGREKREQMVVQEPEMMQERPRLQIAPTPYTGPFSVEGVGQAVIEDVPHLYTPPTPRATEEIERRDLPDRPASSLGFNAPTRLNPPRSQVEIAEANDSDGFEDADEAERIAWNQHPPLSPRGSLILARQGLSQQHEADSYWNAVPLPHHQQQSQSREGNSFEIQRERILGDIIEESEEEASLRRANSNKRTMSSRQSSLMRPASALDRMERSKTEGQAE